MRDDSRSEEVMPGMPVVQTDARGRHRIVVGDRRGEWPPYNGLARLDDLFAATDFFDDSGLPIGIPFKVQAVV